MDIKVNKMRNRFLSTQMRMQFSGVDTMENIKLLYANATKNYDSFWVYIHQQQRNCFRKPSLTMVNSDDILGLAINK